MPETLLLRLIDKDVNPPTGTPDLPASRTGTVDGDLKPFKAALEFNHAFVKKFSTVTVKIPLQVDGLFVTTNPPTGPNLMDENAKNNYLIECQITQGANVGKLFRGEIGQPTVIEDEDIGWIISIPCEDMFRTTREIPQSIRSINLTPKDRFIKIIDKYEKNRGSSGTIVTYVGSDPTTAIDLPSGALKHFWEPFGPKKTSRLLLDVITRLEESPAAGGVLLDHYWDQDPDATTTRMCRVFAEEMGKQTSGVVINPLTVDDGANTRKQFNTDNIVFKNVIIGQGDPNSGTTPQNMQEFRSQFLHGLARDFWVSGRSYAVGDLVKVEFPTLFPDVRFFKANVATSGTTSPELSADWTEDFSIDPTNGAFIDPTPFTSSLTDAQSNIIGKGNSGIAGFEGFMFDWNIERTLWDRDISNNPYQRLSVKAIDKRSNTPPLKATVHDGFRAIIGVFGSTDANIGVGTEGFDKDPTGNSVWIGSNRKKIAEYRGNPGSVGLGSGWEISDAPRDAGAGANREQDTCNDIETAKILKFDGGGIGDWIDQWDVASNNDKSSPFHIVKSSRLITGATGIPDRAFEVLYDFLEPGLPQPFGRAGTDAKNRTSRGVWLSFIQPYPHISTGSGVGALCGGDDEFPFFDTFNFDRTCDGSEGWNLGNKSEELGRVNGLHFKLKVGFFQSTDDSTITLGMGTIPMVCWAMDKFGRMFFQDFSQSQGNNRWDEHTIAFGPKSPQSYFFSRFDELATVGGYKLPFDFNLQEREYTGIAFDWRFVKYWGVFAKYMYSEDTGHYLGYFNQMWKAFVEILEQTGQKAMQFFEFIITGSTQVPLTEKFVTDHARIAIDEFYFVKELYASSETGVNNDPRIDIVDLRAERDYLTLKAKTQAVKARKKFFPQFWHMTARGDVRMKVGQKFTASGTRVPGGSQELVCAEVKHIINEDGYFMEVFGIRKFIA